MAFSGFSSIHKISRNSNLMIKHAWAISSISSLAFLKRPTNGCTPFAFSRKPVFPRVTLSKCMLALYEVSSDMLYQHDCANIPLYLEDAIESVQKRALAVIFHAGVPSYEEALRSAGVTTLTAHRDHICKRFIQNIKTSGFLYNLLPNITEVSYGYTLRSGQIRNDKVLANTSRLNNFVTYKF